MSELAPSSQSVSSVNCPSWLPMEGVEERWTPTFFLPQQSPQLGCTLQSAGRFAISQHSAHTRAIKAQVLRTGSRERSTRKCRRWLQCIVKAESRDTSNVGLCRRVLRSAGCWTGPHAVPQCFKGRPSGLVYVPKHSADCPQLVSCITFYLGRVSNNKRTLNTL